jgi:hypothetical protein
MQVPFLISDENGRKRSEKPYFYFCFYIFFGGNGIGFKKCGFRNGIGIWGGLKRTSMVGNSMETVGSRKLKPKYHTSLYSQITITYKK